MTSPTESPDVEAVVAGLRELQHELRADEFVTRWPKATGLIYQAISLLEGVQRPGPSNDEQRDCFRIANKIAAESVKPLGAALEIADRIRASLPDTTPSGARMAAEDASTLRALAVNLTQQMYSAALALAQTPQRYKGAVGAGEVASQWQPIATAPRDRLVLVRDGIGGGFFDLAFFNGIYWHDQGMRSLTRQPVEWREVETTTAKEAG